MTVLSNECRFLLGLYLVDRHEGLTVKDIALATNKRFPDGREIHAATSHVIILSLRAQQLVEGIGSPIRQVINGRGRSSQLYQLTQAGIKEAQRTIQLFAEIVLESTKLPHS